MNKERRQRIDEAKDKLEEAKSILEECRDEEQDYLDNMPENMQGGEKAEVAGCAISSMEAAIDHIDDATSELEDIE